MNRQHSTDDREGSMIPTCDQIRRAAYGRWLRRGRTHGHDREDWYAAEKELTYLLNYRPIVEYPLDGPDQLIPGGFAIRRCRFCERTSRQTTFEFPPSAAPGALGGRSLRSAEICDDCQGDFREPLDLEFRRFWSALRSWVAGPEGSLEWAGAHRLPVGAFKSLITGALLIMPENELGYFPDTIEWVSNPDRDADLALFAGSFCRVYSAPMLAARPWASLAQRIDDEVPSPYLLYYLGCDGLVIQIAVPLCLRDLDLDGRDVFLPEFAIDAERGRDFLEAQSVALWLAVKTPLTSISASAVSR
jgi:hypothetical protein